MIPEREASDLTDDLEDIWLKESKKSKPSLLRAIWASVSFHLRRECGFELRGLHGKTDNRKLTAIRF